MFLPLRKRVAQAYQQIGVYRDIHSDAINTLLPHPLYPTVFASGSEDGLVGEMNMTGRWK